MTLKLFKCSKCSIEKTSDLFPVNKRKISGVDSHCKSCRAITRKNKMMKANPSFYEKEKLFAVKDKKDTRLCRKCTTEKPIVSFGYKNRAKNTRQYDCKDCSIFYSKKRYKEKRSHILNLSRIYYSKNKHRSKETSRRSALRTDFGLTTEEYDKMRIESNFCCEICLKHESLSKKSLSVDHNHATGKVRGLLCQRCNTGIGLLNSDVTIEIMLNAIDYIKRTEAYV